LVEITKSITENYIYVGLIKGGAMFKADVTREYPEADIISVRANKGNLQFCIFDTNGIGWKILNEGTISEGEVLHFILPRKVSQ